MVVEATLEAPAFLVAVPQLSDPNFLQGVIFLIEHNDEGSMGLLINKPSEIDINEFRLDR